MPEIILPPPHTTCCPNDLPVLASGRSQGETYPADTLVHCGVCGMWWRVQTSVECWDPYDTIRWYTPVRLWNFWLRRRIKNWRATRP